MATNDSTTLPMANVGAWREGRRRALELLRDLEATSGCDTDCEDDCREGRPQANVVHGHLLAVMATQDQDVIMAFSSVLTHAFGNSMGGVSEVAGISRQMRSPIPTRTAGGRARVPLRPFS